MTPWRLGHSLHWPIMHDSHSSEHTQYLIRSCTSHFKQASTINLGFWWKLVWREALWKNWHHSSHWCIHVHRFILVLHVYNALALHKNTRLLWVSNFENSWKTNKKYYISNFFILCRYYVGNYFYRSSSPDHVIHKVKFKVKVKVKRSSNLKLLLH